MPTHSTDDPFDLQRFLDAQVDSYTRALAELRAGAKSSHWMWFIFPQLRGLGRSPVAARYGIEDRREAEAYLAHPVLGSRLVECCDTILGISGKSAHEIFGSPDDMKLRSCATLFAQVAEPRSVFHRVLDRFFDGKPDQRTLELLVGVHRD